MSSTPPDVFASFLGRSRDRFAPALLRTICIVLLCLGAAAAQADLLASRPFVLEGQAAEATSAGNGDGISVLGWQAIAEGVADGKLVQISRLGKPIHDPVVLPDGGFVIALEVFPNESGGALALWLENDCPVCSPPPPSELYLQRISANGRLAGDPRLLPSAALAGATARQGGVSVITRERVDGAFDYVLRSFDDLGRPVGGPVALGLPDFNDSGFIGAVELQGGDVQTVRDVFTCGPSGCQTAGLQGRKVTEGGVSEDVLLAERSQGYDLAALPDGRFLLAWLEPESASVSEPTLYRIRAREWTPQGPGKELALPADLMGPQLASTTRSWVTAAADREGRVMVVWTDQPGDLVEAPLKAQAFDRSLDPVGLPFELTIVPGRHPDRPRVVAEDDGEFLVTWISRQERESVLAGQRFRFTPEPCRPSPRSLCFFDGRFEGEAYFRTPQGQVGWSAFAPLSDQAGYAWFGRQGNPELLLKMLNGNPVNGHFWLFAGSLTTSAVEMRLLDTATGEMRHFSKPAGTQQGFGEQQAFEADPPNVPLVAKVDAVSEVLPLPVESVSGAGAAGTCEPSPTTVCLLDGRFRLELDWAAGRGRGGEAFGQALSESSGVFWYRQERNPEVLVKILDGTAVNGRYWLFFGSATAAAIELTVTDTLTGASQTYSRRAGSFEGGRDQRSFGR